MTEREKNIPKNLKPFKGTFSGHQVIWDKFQRFTIMRSISCFLCDAGEICHHNKHLGFIENQKNVQDPVLFEDYDVLIPLAQTKPSEPKIIISKSTCTKTQTKTTQHLKNRETNFNIENQPSCSKSIIKLSKDKIIPPRKRIQVLSDITIKDVNLPHKKKKI